MLIKWKCKKEREQFETTFLSKVVTPKYLSMNMLYLFQYINLYLLLIAFFSIEPNK